MLEQKTSIEVGANQSSTQRVRPMPPWECADKISSTASAEFSDSKVHNVVTRSSAEVLALPTKKPQILWENPGFSWKNQE